MANRTLALKTYGGLAALVTAFAACGGGGGTKVAVCKAGAFTACGGDPTGTWHVSGICSENNLTTTMNQMYASQSSACATVVKSVDLSIAGTVTYTSGTVTYNMNNSVAFSMSFSSACISGMLNMSGTMNASLCSSLGTSLTNSGTMTGTCSLSGSNCDCTISEKMTDSSSYPYSVSGSTITESGGDSYDFCVSGKTMSERQDSSDLGFAVLSLTKS